MWKRIVWALLGGTAATAAAQILDRLGIPAALTQGPLLVLGMFLALRYGERTGKIATPEELNRPVTLFGSSSENVVDNPKK